MCCSLLAWAQNTVTGTVLDESNLEVIGANVKEKGTANEIQGIEVRHDRE